MADERIHETSVASGPMTGASRLPLDGSAEDSSTRGQWLALWAAILGWLFDGLEMGLFPLVARPALRELLSTTKEGDVGLWFGVMTAGFLVGAATGGVLFGWLGDRIGRVRAMTLSVLAYTLFTGACGFAQDVYQLFGFRVLASLGMGGEWSLGVSLVMEVWPNRSRGWLAGLIGAASNVGFMLIAVVSLIVANVVGSETAGSNWRLLMFIGAAPALLTFLIRLFVPESERWLDEHARGTTSHWASRDLLGVLIGACGPLLIVYLWAWPHSLGLRIVGTVVGFAVALAGYLFPVLRFLQRSGAARNESPREVTRTVGRMLIGACLSGVALIGTWGAVQLAPTWADALTDGKVPEAKAYTQIASGIGAILGTIVAAVVGARVSRRRMYIFLCAASLASALAFFQPWMERPVEFDSLFLLMAFIVGGLTASFYGWLPLYLPELFGTRVRATGQGFAYNFGRILAAIGALQVGFLIDQVFHGSYPLACSTICAVYLVGLIVIWLAPETKDQPLPE